MKTDINILLSIARNQLRTIKQLDPDVEGDKVFTMVVLAEDLVCALDRAYEEACELEELMK